MIRMRYAAPEDKRFWLSLDRRLGEAGFEQKTARREGYVVEEDGRPVGVLRYNLFWDEYPFLNLVCLEESCRGKGIGTRAVELWEAEMKKRGHEIAMTSTMVEEGAQHFYRKLGYKDCGCLVKDTPPLTETMEMFLIKRL